MLIPSLNPFSFFLFIFFILPLVDPTPKMHYAPNEVSPGVFLSLFLFPLLTNVQKIQVPQLLQRGVLSGSKLGMPHGLSGVLIKYL